MNDRELAEFCERAKNYSTITVNEVEVLLEWHHGTQYVAIRGTEASRLISGNGWIDVLRDMRIIPWRDKHLGWCHSGFLKGAREVLKELDHSKNIPIVITGHSLGAAVGQLLALKLAMTGHKVKFVGFGMPRCFVGRPSQKVTDCAKVLEFKHYRYKRDIVSNIPHRWFLKYRHAVKWTQLVACSDLSDTWKDHSIKKYIGAL